MLNRSRGAALRGGVPCVLGLAAVFYAAGAVMVPSDAEAYVLEGLRWPGQPTSGCCANLNMEYLTLTQTYDSAGYYTGFISWEHGWGSGVNVNINAVSSASWTADDVYYSSVSWDGITIIANSGSNFTAVGMHLNWYYTQGYAQPTIGALAAHEIGHGLGLADVNSCTLMQPSTPTRVACGVGGPTADDKNGVNAQY
jgi:hypothetical protein